MSKIMTRAISGAIYVAIIIAALLGGGIYTCLLALLLASLAGYEFIHLTTDPEHRTPLTVYTDMAATLCLTATPTLIGFVMWGALLIVRMVEELYVHHPQPLRHLATSIFGQIYIGLPLAILMGYGEIDYFAYSRGFEPIPILLIMLAIFVMIWLNDTGAYLVGSRIGRHKMWERISPKKTWEGFAGGAIFCIAGGVTCNWLIPHSYLLNLWTWMGLGVVVAITATWGDLIESLFKRSLGVKDSGNLIPGHGGILDRIDSLLLVLPSTAIYLIVCLICHTH